RAKSPRMLRWGGGAAVAASVALLAVFAGRQLATPDGPPGAQAPAPLVAELATSSPAPAPAQAADGSAPEAGPARGGAEADLPLVAEVPDPSPEAGLALAASAVALTEAPRRATERRSRSQAPVRAVASAAARQAAAPAH